MSDTTATAATTPTLYPTIRYDDAPAALRFLTEVLDFTAPAVMENPDGTIGHAEAWHGNGMVMVSSRRPEPSPFDTGKASIYVVVEDPDALHGRAVDAGAEIAMELTDQDYGSREFSVVDPEGNVWTLGTYAPSRPG